MKIYRHKLIFPAASIIIFLLIMATMLTACGQPRNGQAPDPLAPKPNRINQPVKVGLVLPGTGQVEDFVHIQAVQAFKASKQKFWVDTKILKPGELLNDNESMRFLADNDYEYIITFSSMAKVLKEVAPDYPEINFIVIDGFVEGENITSLVFKEREGPFLAGALAALQTQTGQLGIISTREPGTEDYLTGFQEGVQYITYAEPKPVALQTFFTPTDISAVEQVAYAGLYSTNLYDQQVDIIMPVPRKIADPVFKSAAAMKKFAIGIDENQNWQQPGNIIASTEKRVDVAVNNIMKQVEQKKKISGIQYLGVAQGATGLTDLTKGPVWIAPEIIAKMEIIRQKVAAGEIKLE